MLICSIQLYSFLFPCPNHQQMTLRSCSDQPAPSLARGPASNDSRLAKRQRTSNLGDSTDAGDSISHSDEVDTRIDGTSEEHHWLYSGLTSSLAPVVDLEVSNVSTNLVDEGVPGQKLYTSSLYTDAFNLALETVLAKECHLFSEQEARIFQKYRSLPYEAQYLYCILSFSEYHLCFCETYC